MIKFITGSLRSLGMFLIFLFAVACIFGSIFVRDIDSSNYFSVFLDYTVSFENRFYDFRMKSHLDPAYRSKEIVLVKIDDYSLEKLGVWPIPRTNHAKLIDKLGGYGVKVISFDVLFSEKSPPYKNSSPDEDLARSIIGFKERGGRVFLGYTLADDEKDTLKEPPFVLLNDTIDTRIEANFYPNKISRHNFPIEKLLETDTGLGFISAKEDPDGIFRHYPLVANVDEIYYGSLAYNSFEAYKEEKSTIWIYSDRTGEFRGTGKNLEISPNGEIKIRYIGSEPQFPTVSFYDVLKAPPGDEKMKDLLNGKIVFVGSTALGAHDLRPSPLDPKMPGVYGHMNVAHMLINQHFFKSNNQSVIYSLVILIAGMLLFLFVQYFGNAFLDALVIIGIITGAYLIDHHYFLPQGHELKLFYTFFCFISCYSWNTFLKFYEASKEKKQIKGTFARYVAPTIVDEMLKDPDKLHVGGTKMDITCLFSDVRDFTKISEGLSATELAHSLNMYMGAMTDIVFETKGTLDKYIGDAIVAIWGAPLPIGNHAQKAVEGAIKMMEILPGINEEFRNLGRPEFNVGIGLNSGECSVGNMGSERIFSYTALGDNMNLGARLESLCKYYGAQILISDMTLERLDLTHITIRPVDKVVVKGKTTAVGVHEVLHPHHWMSKRPEALATYLTAYKMYQNREFGAALSIFEEILKDNENDKPSRRLRDACRRFSEAPELVTDEFEVTVMTEK